MPRCQVNRRPTYWTWDSLLDQMLTGHQLPHPYQCLTWDLNQLASWIPTMHLTPWIALQPQQSFVRPVPQVCQLIMWRTIIYIFNAGIDISIENNPLDIGFGSLLAEDKHVVQRSLDMGFCGDPVHDVPAQSCRSCHCVVSHFSI